MPTEERNTGRRPGADSLLAQVGPSQPGGHWQSKPVGTSWHVPPLAQGLEMQACSADGGREVGGGQRGVCQRNKCRTAATSFLSITRQCNVYCETV